MYFFYICFYFYFLDYYLNKNVFHACFMLIVGVGRAGKDFRVGILNKHL